MHTQNHLKHGKMLIALSGGADSVALLLMMRERGENVQAAAHCNFGLRGTESDRDEAFVRQLCKEQGVRLFVRTFDTRGEARRTGESIEMAARRLRYAWFGDLCREHGFDCVAVAHHQDDNAETLLLNLTRGTGLRGLTGMNGSGERGENGEHCVRVVRPLLDFTRAELRSFLARKGQDFVTDSTNTDTQYKRNFVRHEVLPLLARLNPSILRTLNDTARRLCEAEAVYDYALAALRAKICTPYRKGGVRIDLSALAESPSPATLLHEWLTPYGFTAAQCGDALTMRTGGIAEAGKNLLTRTTDALLVAARPVPLAETPLPAASAQSTTLAFPAQSMALDVSNVPFTSFGALPCEASYAALDTDTLHGVLRVRSVREGDRFTPFGMEGSQLVSDYLTARHRSRIDKLAALAVTDDKGIVWLVGERPAARCAATQGTRTLTMLSVHPL